MYDAFYRQIQQCAKLLAPDSGAMPAVAWDHLISPHDIQLPKSVYENVSSAVRALYRLSRRDAYREALGTPPPICQMAPPNQSVLMAYDFHSDENGECYLVEINTNASGFMIASLMQMVKLGKSLNDFTPLQLLWSSFEKEWRQFSKKDKPSGVAVVDENILEQKMYPEFLMYQEWFKQKGWPAHLCEASDYVSGDFVYNRTTDFYFEGEGCQSLGRAYLNRTSCVSPNPFEYWLLADKERLIQLSDAQFLERAQISKDEISAVQKVLIPTFHKNALGSSEDLWEQRKGLFFKPKRSHGGKSAYRGESVSRKVFERLMTDDNILIQKFQPAQRLPSGNTRGLLDNWKFDLRFFVYQDQIQMAVARSYQGQLTNFASPYGGFTFVQF